MNEISVEHSPLSLSSSSHAYHCFSDRYFYSIFYEIILLVSHTIMQIFVIRPIASIICPVAYPLNRPHSAEQHGNYVR